MDGTLRENKEDKGIFIKMCNIEKDRGRLGI